ncbi:MAG: hypothetical protein LQ347_004261 [Umbilicaria vellea]|nr:MAG: hypothetical protein LQ347_004261 [Umbilicaria vellea]
MAGLTNFLNRTNEPIPGMAKTDRQRIADEIRMPKPATTLHHSGSMSSATLGGQIGVGKGIKPSKTRQAIKQELSQSQEKAQSAFDTDVEDFDSTTTIALDENPKSAEPSTESYEYARYGLKEYHGNGNPGNSYGGAADYDVQQRVATDGTEQHYPEQVVLLGEEEGDEDRAEGDENENEDEDGGDSGHETGSEGELQDGNHTVNLTSMSVTGGVVSANDDELEARVNEVKRKRNQRTSLALISGPLGSRHSLPVRNGGNEVHAVARSYRLDNLDDYCAESPSYLQDNRAPQPVNRSGTTGKKTRHLSQEKHSQPFLNGNRPSQREESWTGTTGQNNQRSQPQVSQRESFPSMALPKAVLRKVGGPTTVALAQLEQPEDHTMSSIFDASDLGGNDCATSHSAELDTNHASDPQEDLRMPAPTRPFQLDYDAAQLSEMSFEELTKQPFDHDPRALPSILPNEIASASLAEKLQHVTSTLKADTDKDEKRQRFFSSLTIDEHEECGDLIVEEFSNLIKKLKTARREKRKLAMAYEDEVASREDHVRTKRQLLEREQDRLKRVGRDVISGK